MTFEEWQQYIDHGIHPRSHEKLVTKWQRCLDAGIDPYDVTKSVKANCTVEDSFLTGIFKEEVVKTIEPNMVNRPESKVAWIACDAKGVVLRIFCNGNDFLTELSQRGIEKHNRLTEDSTGVHAFSLAIESGTPACCTRFHNFCAAYHDYNILCSPVFSIQGEIMGFLGIIAHYDLAKPGAWAMSLRFAIQSIDTKIRMRRLTHRHQLLHQVFDHIVLKDDIPSVVVNTKGFIRMVNLAAMTMFELSEGVKEKSLDKLAVFSPPIKSIAAAGMHQKDINMTVRLKKKRLKVNANTYPCFGEGDRFLGVIVTFEEKSSKRRGGAGDQNGTAIYTFNDIIGNSPALNNARQLAKQVSQSSISVLLTGESGTGKEMFAQSIHHASEYADGPFITVNCSAIPREIAESELFGYTKGAFTGALPQGRTGKLEAANNGTIFLDEIGDMPLDLQAKLLRVLETRMLSRVGEASERPVNLRLIAATNRDLKRMVADKTFREDLYYRIAVCQIHLPSLSESKGDIPDLFMNFIDYFNEEMGKKVTSADDDLLELLKSYPWPGNIRELRNAAEYCVMMNSGQDPVSMNHLPGDMRMPLLYPTTAYEDTSNPDPLQSERRSIEQSEELLIRKALTMSGNNATKAARVLGVSRATFYRRLDRLGIKRSKLLKTS